MGTIMMKIKPVVTERHRFDNTKWKFFRKKFLEILDQQYFDARINIDGFSVESASRRVRVPLDNYLDEIRPVIVENYEIEYRQKSKNKKNRF